MQTNIGFYKVAFFADNGGKINVFFQMIRLVYREYWESQLIKCRWWMHDLPHRGKKTKLNECPTKWMMNKEEKAFSEGKSV